MTEEADQQIAGGDGAEQISGENDKQACEVHHERKFIRRGLLRNGSIEEGFPRGALPKKCTKLRSCPINQDLAQKHPYFIAFAIYVDSVFWGEMLWNAP
jgi:hypothetical protein